MRHPWNYSESYICEKPIKITCRKCSNSVLELSILQTVFEIGWIPIFPVHKKIYIECPRCKTAYSVEELEKDQIHKDLKVKSPWRSYFGIIIIGIIGLLYFFLPII